jgi:hypothetical protein
MATTSIPKWNDERTTNLTNMVGSESPVTQATVATSAESLQTTTRSVSSKLRKMGYDVELASSTHTKTFSDEEEATLRSFVESNSGSYTYADIAASFSDGKYSAKSIQGKLLSMELTSHVKPTEKPEAVRTYTPSEEATFLEMVSGGSYVEEIAAALDKSINSVRGKALSFLRNGDIDAIPAQKESRAKAKEDALGALGDIASMTVEQIADSIDKTARGVKTMLTRRGLTCANYDGAKKAAKNAAKA